MRAPHRFLPPDEGGLQKAKIHILKLSHHNQLTQPSPPDKGGKGGFKSFFLDTRFRGYDERREKNARGKATLA
jgi:hypothetical protein